MQVVERKHHIDIVINSGEALILPIIMEKYPQAEILTEEKTSYRGSDLEKDLEQNWKDNPGARVSAFRWEKGLTQTQLADATGMNRVAISNIENGKRKIGLSVAKKLAPVLGCSYKDLI